MLHILLLVLIVFSVLSLNVCARKIPTQKYIKSKIATKKKKQYMNAFSNIVGYLSLIDVRNISSNSLKNLTLRFLKYIR